jgi:hypothetical protein
MVYIAPQSFATAEVMGLERKDFTPTQDRAAGDHFAHAPGRTCLKCGRVIEAGQPARKRGESRWAHDACPV